MVWGGRRVQDGEHMRNKVIKNLKNKKNKKIKKIKRIKWQKKDKLSCREIARDQVSLKKKMKKIK